ncbi:MAG: hypothetical protein ACKVOP_02965 [Sphingomonadaceae bacterium]
MCAITRTRVSASVCSDLTEQAALTQAGVDAAPTRITLKLKQPFTYTYSIGGRGSEAVIRRNVENGSGAITQGTVAFGHFNYARLTGDGTIKIEPLDSEVQDTVANPTPVWRWTLTAMEPGPRRLALDAGVELRAEAAPPVRLGQNSKRIDVAVEVPAIEQISRFADTADTVMGISTDLLKQLAILLGAAGAVLAAYRALFAKKKADATS